MDLYSMGACEAFSGNENMKFKLAHASYCLHHITNQVLEYPELINESNDVADER